MEGAAAAGRVAPPFWLVLSLGSAAGREPPLGGCDCGWTRHPTLPGFYFAWGSAAGREPPLAHAGSAGRSHCHGPPAIKLFRRGDHTAFGPAPGSPYPGGGSVGLHTSLAGLGALLSLGTVDAAGRVPPSETYNWVTACASRVLVGYHICMSCCLGFGMLRVLPAPRGRPPYIVPRNSYRLDWFCVSLKLLRFY